MKSCQSLSRQKLHLQSKKTEDQTLQFQKSSLSIGRQSSRIPQEGPFQTCEQFEVVQKFRQPKAAQQGELVVDLEVHLDCDILIFSKHLQLTPLQQEQNDLLQQQSSCQSFQQTLFNSQCDQYSCVSQESYKSTATVKNLQKDVLGYYRFKNNGLPIKISPFQTISFSDYAKNVVKMNETISQNEDGAKFSTKVLYQNLEVLIGFNYQILEQEVQEQIETEDEDQSETQSINIVNNNNVDEFQQEENSFNTPLLFQNSPQLQSQQTPIDELKLQLQQQQQQIQLQFPSFATQTPEKLPQRKFTDQIHDDEDTTADISLDINEQQKKRSNNNRNQQQRKRKASNSYFSKNYKMSVDYDDESFNSVSQQSTSQQKSSTSVSKKGDKKNVVKNFVKAFRSYLQCWSNTEEVLSILHMEKREELENFRKEWMVFEKDNHYNNKLIRQLIVDKKYSSIFTHFLFNKALNWLENSQVQDKQSHRDVLSQYIRACENPHQIDSIIILKSRNC